MGVSLLARTRVLVAGVVACLALTPGLGAFAAVTVAVDGNPLYLNPGPIERSGRIYVPLRGIFERLGAAVVYNSGTINATKANTTVSLQIGSTRATVNGQQQHLDAAPFIVGATTYVPLRFVAQSLGANVGYDGANQSVAIDLGRQPHPPRPVQPIQPVQPVQPLPLPPRVSVVQLRAERPRPGAVGVQGRPEIAAEFTHRVDPGSLNVTLDDTSITGWAQRYPTGFSVTPRHQLWVGSHTVRVTGNDATGAFFERSWAFRVAAPPPPPVSNLQLRDQQPQPGAQVANRQPRISASFSRNVNAGSLNVTIDVTNVTGWTERHASGFSITPRSPLDAGTHTVRVSGTDGAGVPFERSWTFTTTAPTPAPLKPHLTLSEPAPNQVVDTTFAVKGNTVANGQVRVVAGAQPGGAGNFSGTTVAGPYGNFTVNVTLKVLMGQQTANVTVTATNPANSQTVEKRVAVRLKQPR